MVHSDEIAALRDRISVQDELARSAPIPTDRLIHAELAAYYRAELEALEKGQARRFTGFS